MTTLAHVPLAQIHTHPSNPRFDAVADSDMVASVEAQGILTPVTLAPALDGDGYVLIGGHRRLDAATKAGLTQLPAIIRDDLVMEAQQVEAMLVENLREWLTAAGYTLSDADKEVAATVTDTRDRLAGNTDDEEAS